MKIFSVNADFLF